MSATLELLKRITRLRAGGHFPYVIFVEQDRWSLAKAGPDPYSERHPISMADLETLISLIENRVMRKSPSMELGQNSRLKKWA